MAKLSSKFDIPEIPWDLVDEARRRTRKVWEREDLDLREPALFLTWNHPEDPADGKSSMCSYCRAPVRQMIDNPEVDLRAQLPMIRWGVESLLAGREVGMPVSNHLGLHMIHFGTGPLATAFGSRMIVRDDEVVFYEPAVHTPEEVMRLEKPDLHRAGILPKILERIDFYNEATEGRIPMSVCDTGMPWSIATQIWHYEDMLEATLTAPEAVHHLLNLVTECIIEWDDIQKARMHRWTLSNNCVPDRWIHRGTYRGDDCMVAVSPATFEEFFLPYNNRVSRAQGGLCYHCCLKHDWQFPSMIKTEGFMGMDADRDWNDFDLILAALDGRGTWNQPLGYAYEDTTAFERELGWIRRMKGKVGLFLRAIGVSRDDAIRNAKRLLAEIEGGQKVQRYWQDVYNSVKGEARLSKTWTAFLPFTEKDPPPSGKDLSRIPASLTLGAGTAAAQSVAVPDGRTDLTSLGLTGTKSAAYVYIPFTNEEDGPVTLGIGADWWCEVWVDGKPLFSSLVAGNGHQPPAIGDHLATVDLRAGEHLLVVRLLRGNKSSVLCVGRPEDVRTVIRERAGQQRTA